MLWVAAENWVWLVLAALAGAGATTALTLHRAPADDEPPGPHDEPA